MESRLHIVVPLDLVHRVDEAVLLRRKKTGRAVSRNATINELLADALAAEEHRLNAAKASHSKTGV
ncbi:hypothetical protein FHS21_004167 [Phyllobacterium trifolii]|uniref:CopG family transcriptional regulator n=1 Tax=Phyllobacterium trifolii TaxID=300193 RepID=A0A839UCS3_9HYPH|nr:hypothetical protein [Phyllobacterium trifolii]MBB3147735.1 hypothetical protein [Phyllobacterium trifolii]